MDTTVQNGCFTPPLARELGNKLAAGLISLSRPTRDPPAWDVKGPMSRAFEPLLGHGWNRVPNTRINGSFHDVVRLVSSKEYIFAGSANGSSLEDASVPIEMVPDGTTVFYIEKVVAPRTNRAICVLSFSNPKAVALYEVVRREDTVHCMDGRANCILLRGSVSCLIFCRSLVSQIVDRTYRCSFVKYHCVINLW